MAELKMLAIDLGASSGRGIIGKFDGKQFTLEENHRFPSEPVTIAGSFNWDIMRIFHEIKQAINKCALSDDRDIKTIGIDTWGVDYGLLDKHGKLLTNPVHYRDTRTVGIQDYAEQFLPKKRLYDITGIQFCDFNTVWQLAAELRDNPELVAAADKMLFIPDLLNYFLTGKMQTEYTIASTGALLDANTRDWSKEVSMRSRFPKDCSPKLYSPVPLSVRCSSPSRTSSATSTPTSSMLRHTIPHLPLLQFRQSRVKTSSSFPPVHGR